MKVKSFLLDKNATEVHKLSLARKRVMLNKDKIHEAITKGRQLMIEICTICLTTFPHHSSSTACRAKRQYVKQLLCEKGHLISLF